MTNARRKSKCTSGRMATVTKVRVVIFVALLYAIFCWSAILSDQADSTLTVGQLNRVRLGKATSPADAKCALEGSFTPPGEIIIDYEQIRNVDKTPLERVKDLTSKKYVKFLLGSAGREHHAFLNYISATYGDCRHFVDVGTRYVTSSLALGSNLKSPVWTFDLPDSKERNHAFRGKTEDEWKNQARGVGVDIKFHNMNLLNVTNEELKMYLGTWFVMLDTLHCPDTEPFEREFFQRMLDIGFAGVLVLDDIHLNTEMEKWWKELQDGSENGGYKTYDITKVGHSSGTGLVDFSGKVSIKE